MAKQRRVAARRGPGDDAAVILIRSVLYNVVFFIGTFLTVFFGMVTLLGPWHWPVRWVSRWARLMVWMLRVLCGIELKVIGRENLPAGPMIIAAKHQSTFDTFVWLLLLDAPAYILKKELFNLPFWGWIARGCGHIAVDRAGGTLALRGMVRAAKVRLQQGRSIIIFPEGTRSNPGERIAFFPGVAALAGLGVPVIPAATDSGRLWGRRAFLKRPGTIHLSILPALPSDLPRTQWMERLAKQIEEETDRLYRFSDPGGQTGG